MQYVFGNQPAVSKLTLPSDWKLAKRVLNTFTEHDIKAVVFGESLCCAYLHLQPDTISVLTFQVDERDIKEQLRAEVSSSAYQDRAPLDIDDLKAKKIGLHYMKKFRSALFDVPIQVVCLHEDVHPDVVAVWPDLGICQAAAAIENRKYVLYATNYFVDDHSKLEIALRSDRTGKLLTDSIKRARSIAQYLPKYKLCECLSRDAAHVA